MWLAASPSTASSTPHTRGTSGDKVGRYCRVAVQSTEHIAVLNSCKSRRRLMPSQDLKALLERIHTRLDESFVGIGQIVSDLRAADLAELINQLTLSEAGAVVSMLPVARA